MIGFPMGWFSAGSVTRMAVMVGACAAMMPRAEGLVILIDFGTANSGALPPGMWTQYSTPTGINGGFVKNAETGVNSPVTLSYTGHLTSSSNNGPTAAYDPNSAVGNPSWVATTTAGGAAADLFYTNNTATASPGQVVFRFGGLSAGDRFSLDFLGARASGQADGYYEYSLNGTDYFGLNVMTPSGELETADGWAGMNTQTKYFDNNADGFAAHRYMNVSDVLLTGSNLYFRATDISTANGNFAALNAMRLTIVPEPSAAVLLLPGLLGMLVRRRR